MWREEVDLGFWGDVLQVPSPLTSGSPTGLQTTAQVRLTGRPGKVDRSVSLGYLSVSVPNFGIICVHPHAGFLKCGFWALNPDLMCTQQALYGWNGFCRHNIFSLWK